MGRKIKDPGVGNVSVQFAKRMINNRGSFNVLHENKPRRFSEAYNYLVTISWSQFFGLSLITYMLANVLFALIYLLLGIEDITQPSGDVFKDFLKAFFFSSQTFTTVGYGVLAPKGIFSGIVSSIEAFVGLMFFAFTTGLLYGRFSKPRAAIRFSEYMVLRDFEDGKALMFRIENDRKSTMINPKVSVTFVHTKENEKGEYVNDFYALKLERDTIKYLPTTWTLVHEIDQDSPLFGYSDEALIKQHGELLIMVSYYDESFNQEVHQLYSYLLKDTKLNCKFIKAYYYNDAGDMILDHELFDAIEPLKS
ncbi:ion transporter [Tamlana fucoidanivorans]|uniref:Ion transporter n=1 Tax=Allotamlana fucoidanivorans TaxID=2583814 RepID=A0A5C4SHL3_9FLAO|nr:ion channel [Tamlana fucoidanivorans]TNJ43101.1 ion transporter [Tamlana fucoidanivorans]